MGNAFSSSVSPGLIINTARTNKLSKVFENAFSKTFWQLFSQKFLKTGFQTFLRMPFQSSSLRSVRRFPSSIVVHGQRRQSSRLAKLKHSLVAAVNTDEVMTPSPRPGSSSRPSSCKNTVSTWPCMLKSARLCSWPKTWRKNRSESPWAHICPPQNSN